MRMARAGVIRAVVVTSIVWLLVDVVVLFYYLDSSSRSSQSVVIRANRKALTDNRIPLDPSPGDSKKEVIDVPHAKALSGGSSSIDPVVQQKLNKLLSLKSFQPPEYGEDGVGVPMPPEMTEEKEKRFLENQFNVVASEMISVNRSLPDYRSDECRAKTFLHNLPKTSIIIVFHNEAWTTLLRTLHSVINRSPLELLQEIILIDDLSDRDYLKAPLDAYIKRFPVHDSFEYITASDTTWGGFNWHLNFRWYPVPKREMVRRKHDRSSPIQTPTIAGGLFAIDKQFFYDIGSYDEGMQVWGGENLEISFRVIHHNAARTAEVWMDHYKQFFYKMVPAARNVDPGDVSARRQLRANLQCKNFEWYLRNIYPEAPLPYDYKSLGAIVNQGNKLCLDTMGKKDGPVAMQNCHGAGGNQAWSLTERGEIRSDDLCLSSGGFDSVARIERCNVASPSTKHLFKYNHEEEHMRERQLVKNYIRLGEGMYISPERVEHVLPKKDPADMTRKDQGALPMELLTAHTQMRYVDHSFDNIRRYNRYRHFQHLQYDQRMIPERLLFLGPDLAAAHFLVHRGASVKFVGDDAWYKKDKSGNYDLPGTKVPGLFLEAIDASGTELMFEGFENLQNLSQLRMLRLAGCPYVDDWTLSRIGGMMEGLEMLDLSGCHRISAKDAEISEIPPSGRNRQPGDNLSRFDDYSLVDKFLCDVEELCGQKALLLHAEDGSAERLGWNLGKAALLLEETIPKLKVLGVDYEHELEALEAEVRLLENPNVIEDAKGNLFAEDDNGRLFYIRGNVNERPAVCDNDKPIMTSTIRREIPKMSDEEFERIDRLSGGKLRHLLVGSPSGYEWNSQVETILQFEADYNEKRGIYTDPKMLPKDRRKELPEKEKPSLLEEERMKFLSEYDEEWKMLEKKLLEEGDSEAQEDRIEEEKKERKQSVS
ncbi:hypothetical protein GCK32_004653 [Trichostrongylus colubriformis]|uniref:Polypeptide N-acetylgalactosaminyltransferase n=1 Tax=Trichostrongylus colubriformis TaxID=6319 RepID=A0AAN8FT85_TRICO